MNDSYREILVARKNRSSDTLIRVGMITLTVVMAAAGLLLHPFFFLAAIACGAAAWFVFGRLNVEFEYLYINGDFDVDRIYNRQRRKRAGSYPLEQLELIAPAGSHELDAYRQGAKVLDYTSGENSKSVYTAVYRIDGTLLVNYELDREIIQDLRRLAPRKVSRECLQ